ncbi:MAG: hypothetical protein GX995_04740 [Clostridiales bacterium]|nr:hypothetical protein [Clostridiales bacterium]
MKRIPIWFIAFLGLTLFSTIALGAIHDKKDRVDLWEETLQGDVSVMDGLELDLGFTDYRYLWWDIDVLFNQGMEAVIDFKPLYNRYSYNSFENQVMVVGDNVFTELEKIIEEMDNGIKEIKIADYIDYMTFEFAVNYEGSAGRLFDGENHLYKVKIPESALAIIEKNHNSHGMQTWNLPHVRNDLPSINIGDRLFFTIPSLELANLDSYQDQDYDELEYYLKSGILSIPIDIDRNEKISYDNIKVHYPLELDQNSNQYIIGMAVVTDKSLLVLTTLEENKIYAHLYDPSTENLILRKEISQIPEDKNLRYVTMNSQDGYLLIHYEYGEEVFSYEENNYSYLAEVFEIRDGDIVRLISNDYLASLNNKYINAWYVAERGLFYANNKMFLISRDNRETGDGNTGLLLMAIDNDDILYFGSLNNSMMEDYTIATTSIDGPVLVRGADRRLENFEFGFR